MAEGKKKTGRPPKDIDAKQVEALARIHCTNEEIAAVLGCSADTLVKRFSDCIQKGRAEGKSSLRRVQWKAAKAGNPTMLIWLGKQLLGQKDKHEVEMGDGWRTLAAKFLGVPEDQVPNL